MGLRLALLSTARINTALVAGARASAAVAVVAIGSRDRARAEAQARELGVERAHGSYEDVLADPDVDAVYVPLPNALHVEWAVRALEAGKHVLCEKPLTRRAADAERAFDVAERAGRVLAEAFMWRHTPQARRLVDLLPRVGAPRLVRSHFSFPLDRKGDVRLDPDLDGGALMDVGSYCVSAARLVLGEPAAVTAQQVGAGVDMRFVGTLAFASGGLAHFDCGFDLAHRAELEVVGEAGALRLADPFHSRDVGIELGGERVEVEFRDPYACELDDFAAACAGGAREFGREDAVGQARAIEALYAAAASGRTVDL